MQKPNLISSLWPFVLAIALAIWIGRVELRADEPQGPAFLILISAFGLGSVRPRLAWLWAIGLGGVIFAVHVLAKPFGWPELYPPEPNIFAALIALPFGFAGAFAGVFARWLFGQARKQGAQS